MLQNENFLDKDEIIAPCNSHCSFCFLNYADVLGNNYLFRGLEPKQIGQIIREVRHQVRKFGKGDLVASMGEEYNHLMIIVRGAVVGEMVDFEGKVLRIEHLKAPDTIATAFIFGENNTLPVSITATEETKLLLIPKSDLLTLFKKHEQVLQNYLDIMANRAQHLSKQIKLLGLQTIRGKIAHYLLDLARSKQSDDLVLPHTQIELSEMFGVARPSIGRVFREMDAEGLINARGKSVKIIDKTGLSVFLK